MNLAYKKTTLACFIGYIVQGIVNNFVPLLFLTLQTQYQISLSEITSLITVNFLVQLTVDLLSAGFVDKIGYRASVMLAHIFAGAGLIGLTILPEVLPSAFAGMLLAVIIYALGGGLLEVLVSPLVEACPTENKEKTMSMLHSFYCWGQVGVVLLSTLFFAAFGIQNWKILAIIWALIPLCNTVFFAFVPMYSLHEEGEKGLTMKQLFSQKIFWIFLLMMVCAGASELSIAQWASAFAEQGLGVSKTVGDLTGPMAFAVMMGISRVIYGKYGHKMDLQRFIIGSSLLCILSYLCVSLIPIPLFGMIGCAVSGFSVGILWPGTYSKASASIKGGGTAMFALLALAGDLGCSCGPTLAGMVSDWCGGNLRPGILAATIFPVLMLCGALLLKKCTSAKK